jgi:hypothetical protein
MAAVSWSETIARHPSCVIIARPWSFGIIGRNPLSETIGRNPLSETIALFRSCGITECQEGLRAE